MQALLYDQYGSADVLRIGEIATPAPKRNEVLVKVHAVSINDWDAGLIQGQGVNRILAGLLRPKMIVGSDIAGTVVAVGEDAKRFRPGDAVFGDLCRSGFGGFAEYVCAAESALAPKPDRMTFEQAAALPQAGTLAYQGLFASGPLQPGQTVLINGAGGGVGTLAIQIARLHDVEVTGVDSAEKLDLMRSLGFHHVIDYRTVDFTNNGRRYDLILDTKTNRSLFAYTRALNPGGTYVTLGGTSHLAQVALLGPGIARLMKKHISLVMLKPNKALPYLCELFAAGKLVPVIDSTYKFSQAPDAFRFFASAKQRGKIVITFDAETDAG